jgi:hypothetical protein
MGIFDLLSREGRAKSALDKHVKKATNKLAQSQDRFAAMEKLKEMGGDEATYGLVRRFGFVYDKTIEDEQEKEWVESTLVGMGDKALPSIRKYILQGETVSWPLRVLGQIASPEKVVEIIDELIAREEPGYTRHPQKKIQFLTWLGDWKGAPPADIARRVVPYLTDFDETVRFSAIEALAHQRPDPQDARGPLLDALIRPEEESRRIRNRIAEVLADLGWRVDDTPEHQAAVAKLLATTLTGFTMTGEVLQRKAR